MKLKSIIISILILSFSLFGLTNHTDGKPIYEPINVTLNEMNVTVEAMDDITVAKMENIIVYPMTKEDNNTDDNTSENNQTVTFTASSALTKGWNLMGITSEIDKATLIENIGESKFLEIQNFDASTFTNITPTEGYWIKVSENLLFDYLKIENFSKTTTLQAGWNLINPLSQLKLNEILTQVGEENLEVIHGLKKSFKKVYRDDNKEFLNDFIEFEQDKAYWVKVVNSVNLIY